MPVIDNYSPPTTAEDLMVSSALAVSPIMTASIFDEMYTTHQHQLQLATTDTLAISEQSSSQQDEYFSQQQQQGRRRHHRRSYITPVDTSASRARFVPPPPSARWRRRLERVISATTPGNEQDGDEDFEVNSSGDEDRFIHSNHIGLITPHEYRARGFPRSATAHFIYGHNCLDEQAVNTSPLCGNSDHMLEFDVVSDDGGQFGAMYGIENLLLNDGSVYCSGRKGAVNILTHYCGYIESGLIADTSCSISKMVIKAPQHGFTAPCKEGLIFVSHKEIDVSATSIFDHLTKAQYDEYVKIKKDKQDQLDDTDPVAWFTLNEDKLCVVDLANRAGKYVLIKLLRADHESDNIDMQYIGYIGHSGARSFGSAKLC